MKCINKVREKSGRIKAYVLEDEAGRKAVIDSDRVKYLLKQKAINITNLKLTSDNRVIDSKDSNESKEKIVITNKDDIRSVAILETNIVDNICIVSDPEINIRVMTYEQVCIEVKRGSLIVGNAKVRDMTSKELEDEQEYLGMFYSESQVSQYIKRYRQCGKIDILIEKVTIEEIRKRNITDERFWQIVSDIDTLMKNSALNKGTRGYMVQLKNMIKAYTYYRLTLKERIGFYNKLSDHIYEIYGSSEEQLKRYNKAIPYGDDTFKDVIGAIILIYGKKCFQEFKKMPLSALRLYNIKPEVLKYDAESLHMAPNFGFDIQL